MLTLIRCGLAGALVALASCQPALAQIRCATIKAMLDRLKERYGEVPVFAGMLSPAGAPIVITVSPSGSWSMLASGPDGKMLCLALSGENWSGQSPAAAPGEDS